MSNYTVSPKESWTPERVADVSKNIAIVTVAGVALGVFAALADLYYVAALIGAALLAILVAWQYEAAVALYVLVAFIPWGRTPDLAMGGSGMGKGLFVSQIMLGFLLTIWFGRYMLSGLPKNRIKVGFYTPLALYLAFSVLNVVHSYIFWDYRVDRIYQHVEVNMLEVALRVLSAGVLIVLATTISNSKWLRWITLAALVPGLYNLLNTLAGSPIPVIAPWWSLVALLPISYCLVISLDPATKLWLRGLGIAIVAIAVFVIVVRSISWVSGWLGLTTALGTIAFLKNKKTFIAFALIATIAVGASWTFFHSEVVVASKEEGDFDRFSLMKGAWKYAMHFPLGVGLGNYRTYNTFHYGEKWGTTSYTSAHGTYSQHLSETGVVGTLLLVLLLASIFKWMYQNYREIPPGFSKNYLLATLGHVAGITVAAVIGDYIIPTYHNGGLATFSATVYSWIYWGLAVAHVRISKSEENGPIDIDR